MTKTWTYEVEDFTELCWGVIDGTSPSGFLYVDHAAIMARISEDQGKKRYPGLKITEVVSE